jgi:hypothetical protein
LRFPAKKFLPALLGMVFTTCGIEDYPFLYPVNAGSINVELNSKAVIALPDVGDSLEYFTHFAIYYRIYLSTSQQTGSIDNVDLMRTVNATLASDYSGFLPYTSTNTTNVSTPIESLFSGRSYRTIMLSGVEIDRILSDDQGLRISLDFTQTVEESPPTLNVLDNANQPSATYPLMRSNGKGLFTPVPTNRYFLNTAELNASANATATVNADVVNTTAEGERYAYVALYVVVVGIDGNFSPIYSAPTFIGVLRLP